MKTFKSVKIRKEAIKNLRELGFRRSKDQVEVSDYEKFLCGSKFNQELLLVDFALGRFIWQGVNGDCANQNSERFDTNPRYIAILNALYGGEAE